MKAINLALLACAVALLGGCATTAKPTYVSPTQYQSLNCEQINDEFNRIQTYINNGVQTPKSTGVGVGLGIGGGYGSGGWGWGIGPTISVNMGQASNSKKTELSRLYGQQDALTQAAQFKSCAMIPKRQSK